MRVLKVSLYCLSLLQVVTLTAELKQAKGSESEQSVKPLCPPKFLGHCPSFPVGGDVALAIDYFRSLPDGSWSGNFGAFSSLNLAVGLPKEKYGFGVQIGGSYGLYDWNGRGSNSTGNTRALQQQAFLTAGLFRMTPQCSGFNAGVVYDFMFNKEFGVFALNPTMEQLRAQFGYLIKGGNELGFWGGVNTRTSHKRAGSDSVKFRAIPQVNFFWSHYFKNRAQTMLWGGTPYRRGLRNASGRAGLFIVGASFKAPLTHALSIIGHGVYMAPRSGSAFQESRDFAANVCFGVNYSFGGCKSGERPYLPLADNSNFLVDTNLNF